MRIVEPWIRQDGSDERERLRAALGSIVPQGREPATDAELDAIGAILEEERRLCTKQLAALPAMENGAAEAMGAFEEPFRCLLFIRARQRLGELVAIDGARLVLYAAASLGGLEGLPGLPGRLLASLLAAYIKQRVGPDFLRRLPESLSSSEVKPLLRYLVKRGEEGQMEALRSVLRGPGGIGGDRLANLVVEAAVESLFGQAMVHRLRHQPTSIIYYDLLDRGADFVKDGERRSLLDLLEKTTVARARELQALMDDLLFAEYGDSRLLERIFGEGSYSLRFGREGDFINAIDMAYGERPVAYFGGKGTGLLAFDATSLSTRRWDLGVDSNVRAIAASPSGKLVAVGYENGTVLVFDPARSLVLLREKKALSSVRRLLFEKDEGGVIAAGNREDDAIVLLGLPGGEKRYLKGHGSYVNDLALSPEGHRLYSAGHDRLVIEWDLESGRLLSKVDAPASLKSLCASRDGMYLYSGDNRPDGLGSVNYCGILRWNAHSLEGGPRPIQERAHRDSIRDLSVSESGKYLFSSSLDGRLRIWDSATGSLRFEFPALGDAENRSFFLSPDCRYCATGDSGGNLAFWNVERLVEDELEKITAEQMRLLAPYRMDLREGTRLEVDKVLGDYQLRGGLVRTFPNMIAMIAAELAAEGGTIQPEAARRLELVTILHETAHAVGVLGGRDRRDEARAWPVELHETIAQYATWYLAKYDPFDLFRDPGLLELFERLALRQGPEYNAFASLPSRREDLLNALAILERRKKEAAAPVAAGES
jgi:hypothetical protein